MCLRSLSCCMSWWLDIVLWDFLEKSRIHGFINYCKLSRSRSSKAAPDHHTSTTRFDFEYDVLFLKCCVLRQMNTFQKVPLLSRQSTESFPKSLGDHQDVQCGMGLCLLFAHLSEYLILQVLQLSSQHYLGGASESELSFPSWGNYFSTWG